MAAEVTSCSILSSRSLLLPFGAQDPEDLRTLELSRLNYILSLDFLFLPPFPDELYGCIPNMHYLPFFSIFFLLSITHPFSLCFIDLSSLSSLLFRFFL